MVNLLEKNDFNICKNMRYPGGDLKSFLALCKFVGILARVLAYILSYY